MNYEGIEYVVRASLGRDEWVLLIYYGGDDNPTVVKFSGSRAAANAAASGSNNRNQRGDSTKCSKSDCRIGALGILRLPKLAGAR
jgi:hypothetical protein